MGDPRRHAGPLFLLPAGLVLLSLIWLPGCNAEHYRGLDLSAGQNASLIALPAAGQTGTADCGYAAMASLAMYHHVPTTLLVDGPVPKAFNGSRLSGDDLVKMASALELTAFGYQGDLDDLRANIAKGRPIIVLLAHPPRVAMYPQFEFFGDVASMPFALPHWVVVVGFTADNRVILHDPRNGLLSMSKNDFLQLWEKQSRLSILVTKQ